ncbi:hypothetical protein DKY63_31940 [Pseudomonas putida]|uniref:Uncharacterized protein n=1 Tax=Pseudomonas putida TaxID=303 RepID=A0A2Z4RSV5_PSEPU|nr:hypothetical protein [Pseudomonas putida]AWY44273.1 hypothetical protein DKY63_31940 [Pseudomonas putida]
MNSLIIKTMQFIALLNIWLYMLLGLAGGVVIAHFLDTGSGVTLKLGATTISIAPPGSYLLFGFVGLILMFLFAVPFYALWVLMYTNHQLLRQIERNTATIANAAINADNHQSNVSPIDDCLRADPRPR